MIIKSKSGRSIDITDEVIDLLFELTQDERDLNDLETYALRLHMAISIYSEGGAMSKEELANAAKEARALYSNICLIREKTRHINKGYDDGTV